MAAKPATVEDECTCPVCHNLFTNPVVLLCGHSFCVVCLKMWWDQSRNQTCPVCKEISPTSQPPQNLALKNMADALRREKSQTTSEDICRIHGEKLKLFCHDDQQPICVICRDSVKHKKHNCVPLSEAAEEYRDILWDGLMDLKTNLGSSMREQNHCERMSRHIQFQAQQTEQSIREEFQKIHQLLHEDEAERIDALRKEVEEKDKEMKTKIEKWKADVLTVTEKVETVQKEAENEDLLLLQNLNSTLQRLEHTSPNDEGTVNPLIDQDKHLKNLQLSIWEKISQTLGLSTHGTRNTPAQPSMDFRTPPESRPRLHQVKVTPRVVSPPQGNTGETLEDIQSVTVVKLPRFVPRTFKKTSRAPRVRPISLTVERSTLDSTDPSSDSS